MSVLPINQSHSLANQNYLVDNLFSLAIIQRSKSTNINMQMNSTMLNTGQIPFIVDLLHEHLPNVLLTQCFNDENLPFAVEVRNTEIGHLFEHILLEYLCQLKIAKGHHRASFAGRTTWNWLRDPKGTFHIYLNCGVKDADILPAAIDKTVKLMKLIMNNNQTTLFSNRAVFFQKNGMKNGKRIRRKVKNPSSSVNY